MNRVKYLKEKLSLLDHPEGGYYKEIYRSKGIIPNNAIPEFNGDRNYCTSIYFLLTSDNFSAFHRIKQDEIWNFYEGDGLEVHVIHPNGIYECLRLGLDFENGEVPQAVVPADSWFASTVKEGGEYSLVGCTVAPGFDFEDFELGGRKSLTNLFPVHKEIIKTLTKLP